MVLRELDSVAAGPPCPRNVSFNQLGLTKLRDGGYIGDAADLALKIQAPMNFDILRAQSDALLYAGRDMEACGDITAHRLDSPEPYWVGLRACCYAATRDVSTLGLTPAAIIEHRFAALAFCT